MVAVYKVRTIWIGARGGGIKHQLVSSLRYQLIEIVLLAVLPAVGLILYSGFEERTSAAFRAQKSAKKRSAEGIPPPFSTLRYAGLSAGCMVSFSMIVTCCGNLDFNS